ncbi:hypothetical protein [Modestobacter sp. SYSU DS0290]
MTDLHTTEGAAPFEEMAAAGHAFVEQLHDEALQVIADLAEHWDDVEPEPREDVAVLEASDETTSDDTATDDSPEAPAVAEEPEEVRVLLTSELPALPPPPLSRDAARLATAATDEFAVPVSDDAALVVAA